MNRRQVRGWLAALTLAPAVVLSACSDSPESTRVVPEGWQDEQVGALRLAVPPGWEPLPAADQTGAWDDAWLLVEDGEAVGRLSVGFDVLTREPRAGLVVQTLVQSMPMSLVDFEEVERLPDPFDLDADFARVRYTYAGADDSTYHGVVWAVGREGEQPAAVQLTGRDIDDLVEKVEAGLELVPE